MGNNTSAQTISTNNMTDKQWGADEFIPRLFLGSAFAADNKPMLESKGITHIISIAKYDFPNLSKFKL